MPNIEKLDIQYVTDEQGNRIFVQIPFAQWEIVRLNLLKEEQVRETLELFELVDKQGILIVKAKPLHDLTSITRHERNHRVSELVQRTGV